MAEVCVAEAEVDRDRRNGTGATMSESGEQIEPVHLPAPAARVARLRLRWAAAAVLLGAVGAAAGVAVRFTFLGMEWLLTGSTAVPPVAGAHLLPWRRALTPLAGGLLAGGVSGVRLWRAHRLRREPRPEVDYVEAVRHKRGIIPFLPNCWRTVSAIFSVGSGAAIGREGSMIQFAAAVTSVLGGWARRFFAEGDSKRAGDELDLSLLVSFGVVGGVVAAYNAPVAAMFFAAEIVLGAVDWRELPLLGLASGAGWLVSGSVQGFKRLYPAQAPLAEHRGALLLLPLLAVLFGLLGPVYQRLMRSLRPVTRLPLPLAWSGLLVGLLSMRDPRVWGNGDMGLSAALGRAELGLSIAVPALLLLLGMRLLAVSACVSAGTIGGVFTPTLYVGGTIGALLAHALPGANPTLWAIAGMSFILAAVTHAPLMAAFMAVELTGDWALLPVLLLLNVISWRLAERLSPRALYAIASQGPTDYAADPNQGIDWRGRQGIA